MRCGDKPEPARRHHEQTGDDATFVAEFDGEPARRDGHEEVAKIMRKLHPGRLRQVQMQLLLEVLVHDIDHAVAKPPEREQEHEQEKRERDVASVFDDEHAAARGMRIHPRGSRGARFHRCCSHVYLLLRT